jgi:hypothetical protein
MVHALANGMCLYLYALLVQTTTERSCFHVLDYRAECVNSCTQRNMERERERERDWKLRNVSEQHVTCAYHASSLDQMAGQAGSFQDQLRAAANCHKSSLQLQSTWYDSHDREAIGSLILTISIVCTELGRHSNTARCRQLQQLQQLAGVQIVNDLTGRARSTEDCSERSAHEFGLIGSMLTCRL